jgi:quercetin dioxygenase-like cupin family protein
MEERQMNPASTSAAKPKPAVPKSTQGKVQVVASDRLARTKVWGETDKAVRWAGAFAVYGGQGATASSTIVYEIEPGGRLGWHTDATEETQYIVAGTGKLYLEDGTTHPVGTGRRLRPADADAARPREYRCAPSPSSPRRCSPRTSTR